MYRLRRKKYIFFNVRKIHIKIFENIFNNNKSKNALKKF